MLRLVAFDQVYKVYAIKAELPINDTGNLDDPVGAKYFTDRWLCVVSKKWRTKMMRKVPGYVSFTSVILSKPFKLLNFKETVIIFVFPSIFYINKFT